MTTDLRVDRDDLQIIRLALKMLYEFSAGKGDANKAQEVWRLVARMEAAIRTLPDKEL